MDRAVKTGISFGITSGIITTLGLMVGLANGTGSRLIVIGGILTIAIADSFSDALGIHVSQESDKKNSTKSIWTSTVSTFLAKLFFTSLFIIPIIFWELHFAIYINIAFGFVVLAVLSYLIANTNGEKSPFHSVIEHLFIASVVVVLTYLIGDWISLNFS